MSEGWAIAMMSGTLCVMTGVIGWVAVEIRGLNRSLSQYVMKTDCAQDMGSHCQRLEKLEAKVGDNSEKLASIEQYHRMINIPI